MSRQISSITVLLYLLQVLIPLVYMPAAFGAGQGPVQLCPKGMGAGSAVLFQVFEDSSDDAQLTASGHDRHHHHHHHHHHHAAHVDRSELTSVTHEPASNVHDGHHGHQASSSDCDYGALNSSQDALLPLCDDLGVAFLPQDLRITESVQSDQSRTLYLFQARAPPRAPVI